MKKGFTLAETLITLVIIGVIAAIAIPSVIQSNKNTEVETKLKKIYNVVNQAIALSELENGPKEFWDLSCSIKEDSQDKTSAEYEIDDMNSDCRTNLETYLVSYLKTEKIEDFVATDTYNLAMYFIDGSILVAKKNPAGTANHLNTDFFFFPNGENFDTNTFYAPDKDNNTITRECVGKSCFGFSFNTSKSNIFHYGKGFEPYKLGLSELTKEALTNEDGKYSCIKGAANPMFCTALIQLNGWEIPDDYPFRVK